MCVVHHLSCPFSVSSPYSIRLTIQIVGLIDHLLTHCASFIAGAVTHGRVEAVNLDIQLTGGLARHLTGVLWKHEVVMGSVSSWPLCSPFIQWLCDPSLCVDVGLIS